MVKFKIVLILSFLLLTSCSDWDKDTYPIIEGNYKLIQDPRHEVMMVSWNKKDSNTVIVPGHILFYGHNSKFIVLNTKSTDSIMKGNPEDLNFDEQNEKIYSTTFNQYFIAKIKTDSVYGPFNRQEYVNARKILNVPKELKFNHSTLEFYIRNQRNDIDYHEHLDNELIDIKNLEGNKVSKMKFPFSVFE